MPVETLKCAQSITYLKYLVNVEILAQDILLDPGLISVKYWSD